MHRRTVRVTDFMPPSDCSHWLVEALHLIGREDHARDLFEYLISLRNDLGLLAEQFDPRLGRMVGNFPRR